MGSAQSSEGVELQQLQSALATIGGGVQALQEALVPAAQLWARAQSAAAECAAAVEECRCEASQWRRDSEERLADDAGRDGRLQVALQALQEADERWSELEERHAAMEARVSAMEEMMESLKVRWQGEPFLVESASFEGSEQQERTSSVISEGRMLSVEERVASLENSLQRALDTMFPRVDALLMQLETPERVDCLSPSSSPLPAQAISIDGSCSRSRSHSPYLLGPPGPDFPPPPPYEEVDSLMSPTAPLCSPPNNGSSSGNAITNGSLCVVNVPTSSAGGSSTDNAVALSVSSGVVRIATTPRNTSGSVSMLRPAPAPPTQATSVELVLPSGSGCAGVSGGATGATGATGAGLQSALLTASRDVVLGDVRALLDRGADPNGCDSEGRSPLHWAASYGRERNVSLLLSAGADPNARSSRSVRGFTPLHEAALRGHAACVQLLAAAGADLESGDDAGWTPLHLAAIRGHEAAARALLAAGALPSARNVWGKRPKDVARIPALRRLLAR